MLYDGRNQHMVFAARFNRFQFSGFTNLIPIRFKTLGMTSAPFGVLSRTKISKIINQWDSLDLQFNDQQEEILTDKTCFQEIFQYPFKNVLSILLSN